MYSLATALDDPRIQPVPETGCWIWTGSLRMPRGYGDMSVRGRSMLAHRVFYARCRGPIPDGMVIDHICRVRSCVNPDHLRIVTPRINVLENSIGPSALHRAKIVCPKCSGPYTKRVKPDGRFYRECTPCRKLYNDIRFAKKRIK